MTCGVLVQRSHSAPAPPGRLHGGPAECGCGRASCHDDFAALAASTDPAARERLRTRIVEAHLNLADAIAGRYRWAGPGFDDIRQVAALALVEAVNRFDARRGTAFSAFAVPTVAGAIKRYFRDQRWMLHPPRRIKELRLRIRAATDPLTQRLRRSPTAGDLAEHLQCSERDVRQALATDGAMRPLSLDAPLQAAEDDITLGATLGEADAAYGHVEDVQTLRPLLRQLPEREQRVLRLRFFANLTQSQIAEQIGCSQMHVSRILRGALDRLRRRLQSAALQDREPHEPPSQSSLPHGPVAPDTPDSGGGSRTGRSTPSAAHPAAPMRPHRLRPAPNRPHFGITATHQPCPSRPGATSRRHTGRARSSCRPTQPMGMRCRPPPTTTWAALGRSGPLWAALGRSGPLWAALGRSGRSRWPIAAAGLRRGPRLTAAGRVTEDRVRRFSRSRQRPVHALDRMIENVQTGHFERAMSGLTALGALVTAGEIFLEHDRASFGNKMMWLPVMLGPVGAAAGVAGFVSKRAAKTALPIASLAIVVNGLQGTYLHVRGIAQRPGGWSLARYNIEMGPPLLAPLLMSMVGGMGLLAAILRRER